MKRLVSILLVLSLFLTMAISFTACKKKDKNDYKYNRRKRIDSGLNALCGHTVYKYGERLEINSAREIAYYKVIKRHCKRHYHTGKYTGKNCRELNLKK